tara:strand:- start:45 stop:305 length:261 start_codon:yes stop_codon:yes gene_type:complete
MIRNEQLSELHALEVNISGYIRDLIDDRISNDTIVLSVSGETKKLYDQVISNSGQTDLDLEPYVVDALKIMIKDKISEMQKLHDSL